MILFLIALPIRADHQNEPYAFNKMYKYKIKKSENYHTFETDLVEDEITLQVKEQLKKKKSKKGEYGLVSYILYEDGKIKIDQKKKSKYGKYYPSHSIGKSLVSIITGYAACEGYIDFKSLDARIDYWPTIENTLYENQKLLNLLNMTAGDDFYVGERYFESDSRMEGKGESVNAIPIKKIMKKYFQGSTRLADTESGSWNTSTGELKGSAYNYSAMTTNVIINYVIFKTGDEYNKLLHKIFNEDAKIKNNVYFGKTIQKSKGKPNKKKGEYGRYTFFADRYDYLRIGKMVMDHWNNNTCVGKYLKTIYDNRIDKDRNNYNKQSFSQFSKSYGGQFHFDLTGLEHKKILGMDGFGGQQLLIDFDRKRIISVSSTDRHYDWYGIVYRKLIQN